MYVFNSFYFIFYLSIYIVSFSNRGDSDTEYEDNENQDEYEDLKSEKLLIDTKSYEILHFCQQTWHESRSTRFVR